MVIRAHPEIARHVEADTVQHAQRAELLDRVLRDTVAVADEWVSAACAAPEPSKAAAAAMMRIVFMKIP